MESPTFENDKSVKLHYKNGDDNTETILTFICKPGKIILSDSICRAFMQMRLRIENILYNKVNYLIYTTNVLKFLNHVEKTK